MGLQPLTTGLRRGTGRPRLASLVGLVLVAAAFSLAWITAEQHLLLEAATTSTELRARSQALLELVLATLVLGLSLIGVLWWTGRVERHNADRLAERDDLTGLLNRRALAARLPRALDRAAREGSEVALLMVGIDGFKDVNDSLGYEVGDRLLVALSERLAEPVGDLAPVARLGGDEFALLLSCCPLADTSRTAERIVELLREPVELDGARLEVSASVGTTAVPEHLDFEAALRRADLAMHEAKRRGGDQSVPYSPELDRELLERLELVHALRSAISERRLRLVYQPVLELSTGLVVGVEALCRWDRNGQPVPPDAFIAVAEQNGLITDLGELVLDLVRSDARVIAEATGRALKVAINTSPRQLREPAFADRVREALTELGPLGLVLEITERDVMDDDPVTRAAMASLTEAGVVFAIDDFGVGYSSLSYLQHLPVGILKVDRTFVATIDSDERACNLLRSIGQLAQALGLELCVEGLERLSQVEHVLEHVGQVCGQGYVLGRPMALATLTDVLRGQPGTGGGPHRPAATLLAREGQP